MSRRHFSELTGAEVEALWQHCVDAAIEFSDEINMGGLSHSGVHNIYDALEDALESEWRKSRAAMGKP